MLRCEEDTEHIRQNPYPDESGLGVNGPKRVHTHNLSKVFRVKLNERVHRPGNAGIGEEDVEPAVSTEGIIDNSLDGLFVGSIELANMNVYPGIERLNILFVCFKIGVVKVADIDGLRPILGKLMGRSATNAEYRVGTFSEFSCGVPQGRRWSELRYQ